MTYIMLNALPNCFFPPLKMSSIVYMHAMPIIFLLSSWGAFQKKSLGVKLPPILVDLLQSSGGGLTPKLFCETHPRSLIKHMARIHRTFLKLLVSTK